MGEVSGRLGGGQCRTARGGAWQAGRRMPVRASAYVYTYGCKLHTCNIFIPTYRPYNTVQHSAVGRHVLAYGIPTVLCCAGMGFAFH